MKKLLALLLCAVLALSSGDIQILNAVGGTSVLLAAANGLDIKIISMYSRSPEAFMMFSNDESLTTPESLAARPLQVPRAPICTSCWWPTLPPPA